MKRGYLFEGTNKVVLSAELAEWNDLKAVAGTGQAVAFGRWSYSGTFASLQPDAPSDMLPHIFETINVPLPSMTDMRVRPGSETPASPATCLTNAGVVKLSGQGAYANLVKELRAALKLVTGFESQPTDHFHPVRSRTGGGSNSLQICVVDDQPPRPFGPPLLFQEGPGTEIPLTALRAFGIRLKPLFF